MSLLRGNEYLVRVARKIRDEGNGRIILCDDASAIFFFSAKNVLKENVTGFGKMSTAGSGLVRDRLEDKIVRVDLAMRVRIGNANCLPFVFEDQNVFDLGAIAKIEVLLLPRTKKLGDLRRTKLGEREIVSR